jgi:hypothetical protein
LKFSGQDLVEKRLLFEVLRRESGSGSVAEQLNFCRQTLIEIISAGFN